jgi:hypothetical protein
MEMVASHDTDSPEAVGDFVYLPPEIMDSLNSQPPEPAEAEALGAELMEPQSPEHQDSSSRHRTRNTLIAAGGAILFAAGLGLGAQRARRPAY